MSHAPDTRMTADDFLLWCEHQEERYELVDGMPMLMTGARRRHDVIVTNAIARLWTALRGKPCRTFTADTAIRIPAGNVRRPDVGVECGPLDDNGLSAAGPWLVIEVLSPSTRAYDMVRKLEEYKSIPSLDHVVLVDPDAPSAIHWHSTGLESWESRAVDGLDASISFGGLDITLALAELYDGLSFRPAPRLVGSDL